MRKTFFTAVLFIISVSLSNKSSAQSFSGAGDYMQYMTDEHEKIHKDMWNYIAAIAHSKSARKVENKRKELLASIGDALKKIKKLPDWKGNGAFRDSVAAYLQISTYVIKQDYGKIVNMEEVAEQSYDAMEAYLLAQEKANDKLDDAFERLRFEQQHFANDNNIRLVENNDKLDQKLERAGAVFAYYNRVYLIFFKSFKQEAYLMDAIQKGDVNAMEQTKNSLATFSTAGLKKLDTIKSYKGDISLLTSCKKMLDFYVKEANDKVSAQIDFFLKKDNFDKQKAAIDAKPQNQRTQDDIDKYNKAITDFNQSVTDYNKIGNDMNTERSALIDGWNNAAQSFLNRQVPAKK